MTSPTPEPPRGLASYRCARCGRPTVMPEDECSRADCATFRPVAPTPEPPAPWMVALAEALMKASPLVWKQWQHDQTLALIQKHYASAPRSEREVQVDEFVAAVDAFFEVLQARPYTGYADIAKDYGKREGKRLAAAREALEVKP